jgi:hypothetical protein
MRFNYFTAFILKLNLIKHHFMYYLPFDIPVNQTSNAFPPFGILSNQNTRTKIPMNLFLNKT